MLEKEKKATLIENCYGQRRNKKKTRGEGEKKKKRFLLREQEQPNLSCLL